MKERRLTLTVVGLLVLAVGAFLLCSTCLCLSTLVLGLHPLSRETLTPGGDEDPWGIGPGPVVEATPPLPTTSAPPDEAEETLLALETAEMPDADLHELAVRFLGVPPDTPRVAATSSPDYPVGTVRVFQVSNLDEDLNFEIEARLAYKTDHVYMWVEEGLDVNQRDIEEAADLFEEHTYPTNREFFGSEWSPGVDGDPHLSILHASNLGRTVAGYFSSADSYVRAVREDSNEMEMFYIHVSRGSEVGDPFYNGVLAHEFQHMIHWNNDRNETTWLNEGCSELAMELNNRTYRSGPGQYDVGGSEFAYLDQPDTQLNTWPEVNQTGSASAHYGASYLFVSYFLDRFGETATQALVAHEENGLESVDRVLTEELGLAITHEDLFADFVIANLIDDPRLANGQYGYQDIDVDSPAVDERYPRTTQYPLTRRSTVAQYGVDYVEIEGRGPLEFRFTGNTQARLMATDAYSGKYLWWSNRGDESDPRLTRVIDLSEATSASLDFWSWYHIEEDWDYAYVVVGTTEDGTLPSDLEDASIDWEILNDPGLACTTRNPNNGNLGCGITGRSDGWEPMEANLDRFVGQEIALRFEYVTDAAVNQSGFAVDDVRVTVDGQVLFEDDSEMDDDTWIAEGFVRHANVLPQRWIVQLVTFGNTTSVSRLLFGDQSSGTWSIPLGSDAQRAVITISAVAPVTTEPAVYEYELIAQP
ncbi:MAG: hypothetical protein ACP5HS_12975 [Anaerolineae bacterium]